jgi:hypothetical protein
VPSIRSIAQTIGRLGIVDGSLWATGRILSIASANRCRLYRYYFVAQPVPSTRLAPEHGPTGIVLRKIEPGDPLVMQFPRPQSVIAERYRMGAVCLAAEKQGRFIGFIWLKQIEYPEDEVRCNYVLEPPGVSAWDFDVYIDPDFRFGRTFVRLWDFANAWLRGSGCHWSLSRISAFNSQSIAAHDRLGTRRIGSAIFLRFGRRSQLALLDRAPFVHVSWRDAHAPTVHLTAPSDNQRS